MWPVSFSMVLQTLQLFNSLHFAMLCAMQSILEQSKRGLANLTVICSILCIFRCFLRCEAFQSIAKEVLQTLQSVSCSILCIFVFAAMQGIPEHTNRRIANPTVVQSFACLHASFNTKLRGKKYLLAMWQVSFSRVLQTLQSVSQLFLSPYFTMLSAVQRIPEHSK